MALIAAYWALCWPYMLGTWVAVRIFGAENPSAQRAVFGWLYEAPWLGLLVVLMVRKLMSAPTSGR